MLGRVAVCFSGQARIDVSRLMSFTKHIITPFRGAGYCVDYFAFLWTERFIPMNRSGDIQKAVYHTDFMHPQFTPNKEYIQWLQDYLPFVKFRTQPNLEAIVPYQLSQLKHDNRNAFQSNLHAVQRAGELCRSHELEWDFRYDWVIRARLDVHYLNTLDLRTLSPYTINTTWEDNVAVDDQFAVSSSNFMYKYHHLFDYLLQHQDQIQLAPDNPYTNQPNIENILKIYLDELKISHSKIPLTITLHPDSVNHVLP